MPSRAIEVLPIAVRCPNERAENSHGAFNDGYRHGKGRRLLGRLLGEVIHEQEGKATFDAMAAEHERWIIEMLADVTPPDRAELYQLLGALKHSVARLPEGPQS